MNKEKKQLRKKYLQERLTLSPLQWQEKSKQICQHLSESLLISNSKIILSYLSFKQEPDLSLLHHDKRKIWGLPRCQGNELIWHQFTSVNDLEIGKYGILEPSTHSPLIYPHQVDLILVPAVGCDRFGYRLGYGGGYYDRLFAQPLWQNIVRMGIVFDFAYVDKLIKESWDKPLDYICTESGIKTPIKEQKE
ncbi:5-formyltetrahydrofolate cyclo-ligase [Cyanobacterium aponinum UTEX 3222]|uniref:5-formyltetrahydrofolate cyclo-ligase n=1 Tax=Cyanobacterium aponinum TaxID=379064 RepID=UPI0030907042|nr:5-formyltetrahydrofolate cyclo-ligase [Cyanobacterium aponinum UTEX 3222]